MFRLVERIIEDIRKIEIQGAENIAKAGIEIINYVVEHTKKSSSRQLFSELNKIKKKLLLVRPTEPCLRNTLNFILRGGELGDIGELKERISLALKHFDGSSKKISEICSRKIKDGTVIFTHCHSSTVINILKKAKSMGRRFKVYNTEARPLFQGRKTAKELANLGIPVTHFVDSAARIALKESDLFLFGADAITSEGKVINKVGTELFAEAAERLNIPMYCCTDSWKFDPSSIFGYELPIEKRYSKEIWEDCPKNIKINNYAFERVDPKLITGIISELGVYSPFVFVEEIKKKYPDLFF